MGDRFRARKRAPLSCRLVVCSLISLSIAGCGSGDDPATADSAAAPPSGSSSTTPQPAAPRNRAPVIAGRPPASVVTGTVYSFLPTATDADNGPLEFSVANLPRWATFNTVNGRLSGLPGPGDVGAYTDITISVSDGASAVVLNPFRVDVLGTATGSVAVSWLAPVENTDGSPLTNLAGYKLYWGTSLGDYPNSVSLNNPGLATYMINQLPPGTYYLVATAFDAHGVESEYSDAISQTVL